MVADGAGGVIDVWEDDRSGIWDVYAQHVLANGVVDPAWPSNGRALCTADSVRRGPTAVSDGAGGALVSWSDRHAGNRDIYAQHILGTGVVDPAWPPTGRALCADPGDQQGPRIVGDGAGGAIVVWLDGRDFFVTGYDLYVQHVLSNGAVDPTWPPDGRDVCTAAGDQGASGFAIVSDGVGGAIVAWSDNRSGPDDIYPQRVLSSGAVDPGWPVDG